MPLTGSFMAARRTKDPQQARLHQVGHAHQQPGKVEPVDPPAWAAPQYSEVMPGPEVVGLEWVTTEPGLELPTPPYIDGHDDAKGHNSPDAAKETDNRREAALQFSTERYEGDAAAGLEGTASTVAPEALRRGLNAEAQNNPPDESYGGEGFRRGQYRQTWVERVFSPPWRHHGYRVVTPLTAGTHKDAPPPANPGPYNSPFSSLARAIRDVQQRPQLRRVPEPVDEDLITDGTETPDVYIDDGWVTY